MTEEEFCLLSTEDKWRHILQVMSYISDMDIAYDQRNGVTTHRKEYMAKEGPAIRLDQYQRWQHVKDLYSSHRDELTNTLEVQDYEECKSVIERVFTQELDATLRNIIDG